MTQPIVYQPREAQPRGNLRPPPPLVPRCPLSHHYAEGVQQCAIITFSGRQRRGLPLLRLSTLLGCERLAGSPVSKDKHILEMPTQADSSQAYCARE